MKIPYVDRSFGIARSIAVTSSNIATRVLSKVMGVMILYYAMQVMYVTGVKNVNQDAFSYFTIGFLVLCGSLILIDMSYNLNRAIGLYAISLSLNRVARYGMNLGSDKAIIVLYGVLMVGFSVNMFVTGVIFLRGSTRSRVNMMITSGIMIFTNILAIGFYLRGETVGSILDIFEMRPDILILLIMYVLLICILSTKAVKRTDPYHIDARYMVEFGHSMSVDKNTSVPKEDAEKLAAAFSDRSSWRAVGMGPVESEYTFHLNHNIHDTSFVRVQKWKDENGLYFTITDTPESPTLNAYRFKAESIFIEDGKLRIFGSKGENMAIVIREAEA